MPAKANPFIGREDALEQLNSLLNKRVASLAVIRGRRRVGKSRLAEQFSEGMKFYRFSGLPPDSGVTAQDQRDEFALRLSLQCQTPEVQADDWSKLFFLLAQQVSGGRVIILFDEITWMAQDDPTFLSKLKNAWELYFCKNSKLILLFCGSVSAWIEKNIINSTGFFGRISLDLQLKELPLPDCNALFDVLGFQRSMKEKLTYLSLTGCIPWYIEQINPDLSAEDNVNQLCFQPNSLFIKEFDRIFHDLFGRRGEIYQRIVMSLEKKTLTYSEIAKKIDYSKGKALTEYLDELEVAGYIDKFNAWDIRRCKEGSIIRYRLSDNYLRFYFKYILPKFNAIQAGRFKNVVLSQLPGWRGMCGLQFETLVLNNRELVWRVLKIDPASIVMDNPYIQRPLSNTEGCQIDYLIQTNLNTLFAIEIKFTTTALTKAVIKQMQQKLQALKIPRHFSVVPVLVYAGDITDELLDSHYFFKMINIMDFC